MVKQKVLLYGCGDIYQKNYFWIYMLFDIVGVVDQKFKCSISEQREYTIAEGIQLQYDFIMVTIAQYDEIKQYLHEEYKIAYDKIHFFREEFQVERIVSFGERNPDITFYVLRAHWQEHKNGFYNFFNRIVRSYHYAQKKGYELVVDMKNYYTEYVPIESYGRINVWEQFYEQPSGYSLEEVYRSQNVILSKYGMDWNENRVGDILSLGHEKYDPYIILGKKYADRFIPSVALNQNTIIEKQRLQMDNRVIIGVLMRGTDFWMKPKGHPVIHDMEQVIAEIHNQLIAKKNAYIYLATEDENIFETFVDEFDDKLLFTNQCRSKRRDTLFMDIKFARENDYFLRGLEYCTVIEVLSNCDSLIANCLCGGAMAALTQNAGKYENVLIFDDGVY